MELRDYDLPDPELVIELDPPIEVQGGMKCERLVLREPTGAEVRQAEGHLRKGVNSETVRAYQHALISKISGVPHQVIDQMPISKIAMASEYLQSFVNPSRATGES